MVDPNSKNRKPRDEVHGWIFLDKPLGMTSTQAVGYIKRIMNAKKAGHGGTLDPLATGVLPIALGEATKTMPYMIVEDKSYEFDVAWGNETSTDDLEGEATKTSDKRPSQQDIMDILPQFVGDIQQVPPQFSAIKIDGKVAYKEARKGGGLELKARDVHVYSLDVLEHSPEKTRFSVSVSKGTYVRSLARDMGRALECYGHVTYLRRTLVGDVGLDKALTQEMLDKEADGGHYPRHLLLAVDATLDGIPVYRASPEEALRLKAGGTFMRIHLKPGVMRVKALNGPVSSLVEVKEDGLVKVIRNFNL
ncbi:MAG: tRNA pseudouridine(55) synthase TruB [Alphaproteobacteria bacterium]|nr:tRNA pseudouridine(55) synthase TruB [Alphaproteobacteria bacterium]